MGINCLIDKALYNYMDGKILIIYYHDLGYPMRATNEDMLYCFGKYSNRLCYYVNAAFGIPKYLKNINFDLILFHDLALCKRSLPKRFRSFMKKAEILKSFSGYKIATVQDEFTQTKILNEFINKFEIKHIFSAATESEWSKVYPRVDRGKVKFSTVLTGYLDEGTVEKINMILDEKKERSLDIGYRATPARYSLGFHGYLKYKIAEVFKKRSVFFDLRTDISNDPKDTFLGLDWYRFLSDCKYTIGVESGASVLDEEGKVEKCVSELVLRNHNVDFETAKKICFEELDGKLEYFAIGPRHLEACATKTCQILIEGSYNGILKAGKHYIPLRKDFSNIDEVLKIVKEDRIRTQITEQAYKDVVESGKYTHKGFVAKVISECMGNEHKWKVISENDWYFYRKNAKREIVIWKYVPVKSFIVNGILKNMPKKWLFKITRLFD